MEDHAPPGWIKFSQLECGKTFHDYVGHIVQNIKLQDNVNFNAVNLETGEPVNIDLDEFIYPVSAGWVAEIRNHGIKISDEMEKQDHKVILNYLFQQCEARKANDRWREELTKYCSSLAMCSFAGPERVVKWVMDERARKSNAHEL